MSRSSGKRESSRAESFLPVIDDSPDLFGSALHDYKRYGSGLADHFKQKMLDTGNSGLVALILDLQRSGRERSSGGRELEVFENMVALVVGLTFDLLRRQAESNLLEGKGTSRQQHLNPVREDLMRKIFEQKRAESIIYDEAQQALSLENTFLEFSVFHLYELLTPADQEEMQSLNMTSLRMKKFSRIAFLRAYGLLRRAATFEGEPEWHE